MDPAASRQMRCRKGTGRLTRDPKIGLAVSGEISTRKKKCDRRLYGLMEGGRDERRDVRWQVGCHDALGCFTSTSEANDRSGPGRDRRAHPQEEDERQMITNLQGAKGVGGGGRIGGRLRLRLQEEKREGPGRGCRSTRFGRGGVASVVQYNAVAAKQHSRSRNNSNSNSKSNNSNNSNLNEQSATTAPCARWKPLQVLAYVILLQYWEMGRGCRRDGQWRASIRIDLVSTLLKYFVF